MLLVKLYTNADFSTGHFGLFTIIFLEQDNLQIFYVINHSIKTTLEVINIENIAKVVSG